MNIYKVMAKHITSEKFITLYTTDNENYAYRLAKEFAYSLKDMLDDSKVGENNDIYTVYNGKFAVDHNLPTYSIYVRESVIGKILTPDEIKRTAESIIYIGY